MAASFDLEADKTATAILQTGHNALLLPPVHLETSRLVAANADLHTRLLVIYQLTPLFYLLYCVCFCRERLICVCEREREKEGERECVCVFRLRSIYCWWFQRSFCAAAALTEFFLRLFFFQSSRKRPPLVWFLQKHINIGLCSDIYRPFLSNLVWW